MISSTARNLALITDDPTTKAKHSTNNEHIDRGSRIPYLQGHQAAKYLKTYVFGNLLLSFQKLPGLMHTFEGTYIGSRCRTAYTKYEIYPITHQFYRAWILPTVTKEGFSQCRNFVDMDGTQMKDLYRMTILSLVALDGNNQIVPLSCTDIVANILQKMLRQTAFQKSVSDYSDVRRLRNQKQPLMLYFLRSEQNI